MAAIYTLLSLRIAIKAEARLGPELSWDAALNSLIEEAYINAVVRDKPREFRKGNVVVALVPPETTLPADFLIPERIEYTTAGGVSWEVSDELYPVCPARVDGKPASFKLIRDTATGLAPVIIFYPPTLGGGDTLLIDYYYRPNLSNDNDEIIHERAIPSIKQEVLQRLQILQNKPADQLAAVLQGYVMTSRKDLSEDERVPSTNTQMR